MDVFIVIIQSLLMLSIAMASTLEAMFGLSMRFEAPDLVHCLSLLGIAWSLLLVFLGALRLGKDARILPMPAKRAALKTKGAYEFCRHPMYSGFIGAAFFWSMYLSSYFALVCTALFVAILVVKVKKEEHYLREIYGDEHKDYCKKVGMFFPKKF
ncbi:MAG: isoprenylcysteine carboxylmethyltransferase family protein [Bdellovibrionota bacterium]